MSNTTGGIVRPAIVVFALLSALTGLIYPMAVTGAAKAAFPAQAAGSLIVLDGYERVAALVESGRGHIKTLVTAVLCCTAFDGTEQPSTMASEADCAMMHASAAARWAGATRVWQ